MLFPVITHFNSNMIIITMCINRKHILYTRYYAKEQKTAQNPCADDAHGLQGKSRQWEMTWAETVKETSAMQLKPHRTSNTHRLNNNNNTAQHLHKKANLIPSSWYIWRKWCNFSHLWYCREFYSILNTMSPINSMIYELFPNPRLWEKLEILPAS